MKQEYGWNHLIGEYDNGMEYVNALVDNVFVVITGEKLIENWGQLG